MSTKPAIGFGAVGRAVAALGALSLVIACGGESGGGSGAVSVVAGAATPTPAPVPSPAPPTTSPTASPFGAFGQTSSQSFTTLGFVYAGREVGGFGDMAVEAASVDSNRAIVMSFAAPTKLRLAIDGVGEGPLIPNGGGGTSPSGQVTSLSYNVLNNFASVQLAQRPGGGVLSSSAIGGWSSRYSVQSGAYALATFVYGIATQPAAVPKVGNDQYDAKTWGTVAIAEPGGKSSADLAYWNGSANLNVDFGAQTVTGTISASAEGGSGPTYVYGLTDVIFTGDGTGFRARPVLGGVAQNGFIEARFAGASANELLVRWSVPIQVGQRQGIAFGVWAAGRL